MKTWEEGRSLNGLDKLSFGTMHLFQSASEQNDRPRASDRLPLDLGTYKFLGGEPVGMNAGGNHALSMLFSGPIQFDERAENNVITFNVFEDRTFVRFYVETPTMTLTLERLTSPNETHPRTIGSYSQSLAKILE